MDELKAFCVKRRDALQKRINDEPANEFWQAYSETGIKMWGALNKLLERILQLSRRSGFSALWATPMSVSPAPTQEGPTLGGALRLLLGW